jgi:arylsulfatase A-like enzyme
MSKLTRRDFLKLTAITGGATAFATLTPHSAFANPDQKGVIIFVFDAMSARNLSVYGYPRKTTPNLERFAARSTVYHAHNSAGNYTTPGIASLLTGTYPWTHRAINISGLIARSHAKNNIYSAFGNAYHRFAYSQNIGATYQLDQFGQDVDELVDPEAFSVINQVVGSKFAHDRNAAYRAFDDFLTQNSEIPASLVIGLISRLLLRRELALYKNQDYPSGPPRTSNYSLFFQLKDVFDGVIKTLQRPLTQSRLSYYHLWAPHAPYRPTPKFANTFIDTWKPVNKPQHRFGFQIPYNDLRTRRSHYDEYIANVDDEFGRLLDFLEKDGLLENNYVVITSDHGDMFERGVDGHITPLVYDPVVHSPLLISSPGQTSQVDITSPTNSVDVLPTLLHLSSQNIPAWCEGQILPGLGGVEDPERATFTVEAKLNPAFTPIKTATIAMRKGSYKLIYYTGYEDHDTFELYDHANDLEELNDLYPQQPAIAKTMQSELLDTLSEANRNYKR